MSVVKPFKAALYVLMLIFSHFPQNFKNSVPRENALKIYPLENGTNKVLKILLNQLLRVW